jgi:hypothetical protein
MSAPRIQKIMLRLWISVASLVSFVVGWAILAQTPRPAQNVSTFSQAASSSPAQLMAPVPPLDPATLQLGFAPSTNPFMLPPTPRRGLVFSTGGS